jgi:hypothetical protein
MMRFYRREMPRDWDGKNVSARYEAVGLRLVPNPFFTDRENTKLSGAGLSLRRHLT